MASVIEKVEHGIEKLVDELNLGGHAHHDAHPAGQTSTNTNRYSSFAPQSSGHVKWFVDGASYFWAVSLALEQARESIYILDWWLSPELYLRRPPAANEQYRLDAMLKACAERGVQINVIVYKEVPQTLTLDSAHTKHALEALHPNIKVFRHPDHAPSGVDFAAELESSFKDLSLRTFDLARLSHDTLKTLYGTHDDVVLFWAHHEKMCIIDNKVAFMGGLDLCFGRWDTNSHPIADVHPGNPDSILFPGQDYNNARIYDFEDVGNWENNKLDRTKSSRMGWSDISISLSGPIVNSLIVHFVDRWNYIFDQKYIAEGAGKYHRIEPSVSHAGPSEGLLPQGESFFGGLHRHFHQRMNRMLGREEDTEQDSQPYLGAHMQLTRSCCPWSSGHPTEHSIANAYIDAIKNAKHFVYIENQFFITATSDDQRPVSNKIGAAIVERILRAHNDGEPFHIIVVIPAVPGFAGDLKSDGALGTRAIMEYQYNSISRGGHSIIESLQRAGVPDPHRYINFYNLRNYDRINTGGAMQQQRQQQVDTVSACYMANGPDLSTTAWDENEDADETTEIDAFVSEELYIHTKVLIADDRLVICGSANLNDRSQLGSHDSEVAVVIEDPTPLPSIMAGESYTASAFAASLRRQLFRKHLGLLPDQRGDLPTPHPVQNWTPVSDHAREGRDGDKNKNAYDWDSPADRLVRDPLDARFRALWRDTARTNTEVFERAFHPVPSDRVRNWADYESFFARHFVMPGTAVNDKDKDAGKMRIEYGHVVRSEFPGSGGAAELKAWLGRVRGNLVEMPLDFLVEERDLARQGLELNGLTDEIYT